MEHHEDSDAVQDDNLDDQSAENEEAEYEHDVNFDDNYLPPEIVQQLPSAQKCLICLSHIRDIVFLECGHLLFCQHCVIFYQRCPVCDIKVKTWLKAMWDIETNQ
ncbi:baculoviral IAP repeat-containing protein 8-like [Ruditapes philippinarum]|uniref:baculoviral IAP repeat-containing protein 8-like n=1 Tax=Ruditapes philippinarum TaxID=129788 RepID=UPI00295B821A|nr:baculoviral IAP repeat-containing protein 8-like [Ruditapes philippinarum]